MERNKIKTKKAKMDKILVCKKLILKINKYWWGYGQLQPSFIPAENIKGAGTVEDNVASLQ